MGQRSAANSTYRIVTEKTQKGRVMRKTIAFKLLRPEFQPGHRNELCRRQLSDFCGIVRRNRGPTGSAHGSQKPSFGDAWDASYGHPDAVALSRDILMSRGKNCPGTIFASQLPRNYPHRRGNFERGKNALSCGGETVWEAF